MENDNGISLLDLFSMFPDDATAERWFEEQRWGKIVDGLPESIYCPHWGCSGMISECPDRKPMAYWCGDCRNHFSVRTGGVSHSKVPLQKWAIAIYLHLSRPQGISACQLARDIRVTRKTALSMLHRIREGWPDPEPLRSKFLEIDEAWFGGDDKKRHRNKKFGNHWRKGRVQALAVVDRESGRADAGMILQADQETVAPLVEKNLDENETLCSDEAPVYAALKWPGRHEIVNHRRGEYVRGEAHTNTIESFWAKAKGTIRWTYRHVSPKYFPRYLKEIVGRHNVRGMALLDQMKLLVSGMLGKRLTYQDLLATEVPPVPYTHHRWKEGEPFRKFSKMTNPR